MFSAIMSLHLHNIHDKKHVLVNTGGQQNGFNLARNSSPPPTSSITEKICRCDEYISLIKSISYETDQFKTSLNSKSEDLEKAECQLVQLHSTMAQLESELQRSKTDYSVLISEFQALVKSHAILEEKVAQYKSNEKAILMDKECQASLQSPTKDLRMCEFSIMESEVVSDSLPKPTAAHNESTEGDQIIHEKSIDSLVRDNISFNDQNSPSLSESSPVQTSSPVSDEISHTPVRHESLTSGSESSPYDEELSSERVIQSRASSSGSDTQEVNSVSCQAGATSITTETISEVPFSQFNVETFITPPHSNQGDIHDDIDKDSSSDTANVQTSSSANHEITNSNTPSKIIKTSNLRVDAAPFCPREIGNNNLVYQTEHFLKLLDEIELCENELNEALFTYIDFSLIDSRERMWSMLQPIYEKAIYDRSRLPIFVSLFKILSSHRIIENGTEQCVFFQLILKKCQYEFELEFYPNVDIASRLTDIQNERDSSKRRQLIDSLDALKRPFLDRKLGNTFLIGELYKKSMLKAPIIIECMNKLLTMVSESPLKNECIESICILLKSTHKALQNDIQKRLSSGIEHINKEAAQCDTQVKEIKKKLDQIYLKETSTNRRNRDRSLNYQPLFKRVSLILEETLSLINVRPYQGRRPEVRNKRFNRRQHTEYSQSDSSTGDSSPLPFNSNSELDFPPIGASIGS